MVFVSSGDNPSLPIASPAVPMIADCVSPPAASPAAMPRLRPNIQAAASTQSRPTKHITNADANWFSERRFNA
jgi:hypothetical protein